MKKCPVLEILIILLTCFLLAVVWVYAKDKNVIPSVVGALVGGGLAGAFTLCGVRYAHKKDLEKQDQAKEDTLKGFYQATHAEVETLWSAYQKGVGAQLEELDDDKPLLVYFPVTQDYFTIYKANSNLIGQIPNADLRKSIVTMYTNAQGLVDSYRLNNHLNEQYESCYRIYNDAINETSKEEHRLELVRMYKNLTDYAGKIKESHHELRTQTDELLKLLKAALAE